MGIETDLPTPNKDTSEHMEQAQNSEKLTPEAAPIEPEFLTEKELIAFEALAADNNILRFNELLTSYNYKAGALHSARVTQSDFNSVYETNEALEGHIQQIDAVIAQMEAVDLSKVGGKIASDHNKILEDLRENRRRAEEESNNYPINLERIRQIIIREFNISESKITSCEEMAAVLKAIISETGRQITYDTQAIRFIVALYTENKSMAVIVEKEMVQAPAEKPVQTETLALDLLLQSLVEGPMADVKIPDPAIEKVEEPVVTLVVPGKVEEGAKTVESETDTTDTKQKVRPSAVLAEELINASSQSGENALSANELIDILYKGEEGEYIVKQPHNSLAQALKGAGNLIGALYPGTEINAEGQSRGDMVYYLDPPVTIEKEETKPAEGDSIKAEEVESVAEEETGEAVEDFETPYEDHWDKPPEWWNEQNRAHNGGKGHEGSEEGSDEDADYQNVLDSLKSWGHINEQALHKIAARVQEEFNCDLRVAQTMVARAAENLVEKEVLSPGNSWLYTNTQQVRKEISNPILAAVRLEARGKIAEKRNKKPKGGREIVGK